MAAEHDREELIDVVVRLPRQAIEEALLSIPTSINDVSERRLGEARALLAGRRRRAGCFRGVRFSDPSWDMILELYVATCEERKLAVTQLCDLSGSSTTTALRHIENMEALGYITRRPDPRDRRRSNVELAPFLAAALEGWLDFQRSACHAGL